VVARVEVDTGTRTVATSTTDPASTTAPPPNFRSTCTACHDEGLILQQRLTRAQWDRELNKMTDWGARVTPEDRGALLDYLEKLRR